MDLNRLEALFEQYIASDIEGSPLDLDSLGIDDRELLAALRSRIGVYHATDRLLAGPRELVGRRLLHYHVVGKLGAGGMGEVYEARDEKLGRRVALKLLSPALAGSPEARRRFEREARLVAALNHPNIVTLHAVEEEDGLFFLAMELVEGRSLGEMGALPLEDALRLAGQMAEALHVAHRQGILHRDLKPANVKVTSSGQVKILDFGLARAVRPEVLSVDLTRSPTQTQSLTGSRMILGTAPYMSPEQARGKGVDERTDIWAFGCVVYEMLAGRRAFQGESVTDVLSAVVRDDPDWDALPEDMPPGARELLERCLRKDPEERPRDFAEIRGRLRQLYEAPQRLVPARRMAARWRRIAAPGGRVWLTVLGLAVVAGAIVATRWMGQRTPPPATTHRQLTFDGDATMGAISPDGKTIAYVRIRNRDRSADRLMVRDAAGGQAIEVFEADHMLHVRWSPDGSELLVTVGTLGNEQAYLVPRLGGSPVPFGEKSLRAWSPDGSELAGLSWQPPGISIIGRSTGEERLIPTAPLIDAPKHRMGFALLDLDWSPSGRWLVHQSHGDEATALRTQRVEGGEAFEIASDSDTALESPRCSPRGDAVYYLRDTSEGGSELFKVAVSPATGKPKGRPRRIVGGLEADPFFTVSADGKRLLYSRGYASSRLVLLRPGATEQGEEARTTTITAGTASDGQASVSPDGTRLAFPRSVGGPRNIFVVPIAGGEPQQLTFFAADNDWPVWSPDGEEIAFGSKQGGIWRVFRVAASGGTPRPFARTELAFPMLAWAPGTKVVYRSTGDHAFHLLDPATEADTPLGAPANGRQAFVPRVSPDGRSVAFWWRSTQGDGEWRDGVSVVSLETGAEAVVAEGWFAAPLGWSPDGRDVLAYRPVENGATIVAIPAAGGAPRAVARFPAEATEAMGMTPDGDGFVFATETYTSDVWLMENFDPEVE